MKVGLTALAFTSCVAGTETLTNPPVQKKVCPEESKILSDRSYEIRDFLNYAPIATSEKPIRIVIGATDDPLVTIAATDIAFGLGGLRGRVYRLGVDDCVAVSETSSLTACLIKTETADNQRFAYINFDNVIRRMAEGSDTFKGGHLISIDQVFDEVGTDEDSITLRVSDGADIVKFYLDSEVGSIYDALTILVGSRYHNRGVRDYFGVDEDTVECIAQGAGLIATKSGMYPAMVVTADNSKEVHAAGLVIKNSKHYSDVITDDVTAIEVKGEEATGVTVKIIETR
ncbi:MAG: hypothetical protein WC595_00570 [Candidatus Nanoarchaeia archaeon]